MPGLPVALGEQDVQAPPVLALQLEGVLFHGAVVHLWVRYREPCEAATAMVLDTRPGEHGPEGIRAVCNGRKKGATEGFQGETPKFQAGGATSKSDFDISGGLEVHHEPEQTRKRCHGTAGQRKAKASWPVPHWQGPIAAVRRMGMDADGPDGHPSRQIDGHGVSLRQSADPTELAKEPRNQSLTCGFMTKTGRPPKKTRLKGRP